MGTPESAMVGSIIINNYNYGRYLRDLLAGTPGITHHPIRVARLRRDGAGCRQRGRSRRSGRRRRRGRGGP